MTVQLPNGNQPAMLRAMANAAVGHNLKMLRTAAGYLTEHDFAMAVGLAGSTISRAENGRTAPTARTLARCAAVLGVDVAMIDGPRLSLDQARVVIEQARSRSRSPALTLVDLFADQSERLRRQLDEVDRQIALLKGAVDNALGAR